MRFVFFDYPKQVGLIAITSLCIALISGCGYQLRGGTSTPISSQKPITTPVRVSLDASVEPALSQSLNHQLLLLGYTQLPSSQNPDIYIKNLQLRRYELVGVLTEVRLVAAADVSYRTASGIVHHQVQSTRSYQYNEAAVGTTDSESGNTKTILYNDLARRIGEQYDSLNQNPKHP